MSDSQPTLARPLLLIGAVVILGLAAWWWNSGASESSPAGSPAGAGEPEAGSTGAGGFHDPEIADSPSRRGPDGGAPSAVPIAVAGEESQPAPEGSYDPPLPTLGVEEPMHVPDPDAPPAEPPPTKNTTPPTPAQALGRAVFWRGMLDGRVEELRRQLELAVEVDDEAAQARARRSLERLEAQRPSVDQRIEDLRQRVSETAEN